MEQEKGIPTITVSNNNDNKQLEMMTKMEDDLELIVCANM